MDFIWDGDRNLAHRTAWWWDGLPNSDPSTTQVRHVSCGVRGARGTCVCSYQYPAPVNFFSWSRVHASVAIAS
jgi:hypothetical protein